MPAFAANLSFMFNEWDFIDRFAAAADAGFEAVEFLFPYACTPDQIARAVRDNGLEVVFFNLPAGDWDRGDRGLAAIPERRAEFRRGLREARPYLEATGARRLHMMSGRAPFYSRKAREAYRSALREALEQLEPEGVTLLIEPINRRDMPGYFLSDYDFALQAISTTGSQRVRMTYDFYHRQVIAGDLMPGFRALLPVIEHIQIASAPGRHEPDCEELNSRYIFEEIDRSGYTGYVGCEYRPRKGTVEGLAWIEPYLALRRLSFNHRLACSKAVIAAPSLT